MQVGVRLPGVRQDATVTMADPQGRDASPLPSITLLRQVPAPAPSSAGF